MRAEHDFRVALSDGIARSDAHTPTDVAPRKSREAAWSILTQPSEPSSRLILIYAISIGAFQGSFSVLALFLNARFQVTELTIGYFFMYTGAISVFARVLLLGRMVDWLGEAKLSRLGLILLAAGVVGMPLSQNLGMLAIATALIPLGTAFTFPCVTALLSRVINQRERGLYMGMQQTYGGVGAHHRAAFLWLGVGFLGRLVALLLLERDYRRDDLPGIWIG